MKTHIRRKTFQSTSDDMFRYLPIRPLSNHDFSSMEDTSPTTAHYILLDTFPTSHTHSQQTSPKLWLRRNKQSANTNVTKVLSCLEILTFTTEAVLVLSRSDKAWYSLSWKTVIFVMKKLKHQ